jgi:hypothetical protein
VVEDTTPEGYILIPFDKDIHKVAIILRWQYLRKSLGVILRKIALSAVTSYSFHSRKVTTILDIAQIFESQSTTHK